MVAPSSEGPPGEVLPVRTLVGLALPDRDPHRAGGAGDLELGGREVVGVEVGHLDLGDLGDLASVIVPTDSRPVVPEPFSMRPPGGSAPGWAGS
jgi:hypothetical protein